MTLSAAAALILLDTGMLATIAAHLPPVPPWPLALAVPASLLRIVLSLRALPRLMQRR